MICSLTETSSVRKFLANSRSESGPSFAMAGWAWNSPSTQTIAERAAGTVMTGNRATRRLTTPCHKAGQQSTHNKKPLKRYSKKAHTKTDSAKKKVNNKNDNDNNSSSSSSSSSDQR
jgi:hypothetical protein